MAGKIMLIVKAVLVCLIMLFSLAILYASRSDFFLAGGSDALDQFFRPPLWSQVLAQLILLLGLLVAIFPGILKFLGKGWRALSLVIVLVIWAISLHNFSYSGRRHMLVESWGIFDAQSVSFNPAMGSLEDIRYERGPLVIHLSNSQGESAYILLGVYPWRLDGDDIVDLIGERGARPVSVERTSSISSSNLVYVDTQRGIGGCPSCPHERLSAQRDSDF